MNATANTAGSKAMVIKDDTIGISNDTYSIILFARFIAASKLLFPDLEYYRHPVEPDHQGILITFTHASDKAVAFLRDGAVAFINNLKC